MIKKRLLTASAAFLLILGLFSLPAYAHDGQSGGGSSTTTSSETTNTTSGRSSTTTTHQEQAAEIEKESSQEAKHSQEASLKSETENELSDMQKSHKKHSDEDRQKNCKAAEKGLETKLQSLSTNATAFQTKIGTAFSLAIAYQKDNNITVAGFDQLVATAQAAKSQAAASVTVLNGLSPNLDCTQHTVATNVASFKVASKQAKTDLIAYKEAVKAVLQALEAAKEGN